MVNIKNIFETISEFLIPLQVTKTTKEIQSLKDPITETENSNGTEP